MKSINKPIVVLSDKEPFASGGNRICFRHPTKSNHCLKVIRPDRTPAVRRSQKRFPANLRPLTTYDENLVEIAVLNYLHTSYPTKITRHLPRSFGLVETDLGTAHETDLICDENMLISQTLEQYIWANGLDSIAEQAIKRFKENWAVKPPHTRDLIPHNFVIRIGQKEADLVLIDGFGRKPATNFRFKGTLAKLSVKRRIKDFDFRIQLIVERKAKNNGPMHRINNLKREN